MIRLVPEAVVEWAIVVIYDSTGGKSLGFEIVWWLHLNSLDKSVKIYIEWHN
jgi:hypothetical protein